METLRTGCCVVGGGPCGMMLGFLLARAGIEVTVLEKHADFFRDFRGDTIHPSTLELMHELGLLEAFLQRPHQQVAELRVRFGEEQVTVADFSHLPTRCKFIAFMPQWDFLDFLAGEARKLPAFHLRMESEVTGLLREGGRIAGVRATTKTGPLEVRADLVAGADGRHSTVRREAGLEVLDLGAPMDVLWFRLPKSAGDGDQSLGNFNSGRILILIDRRDYWQCGYAIAKGTYAQLQERGLASFRAALTELVPALAPRVLELKDWKEVHILTVAVDRLRRWHRPGLLCLGDSAHAMSPVGGIGINLAIQDAVAAANLLGPALRRGAPGDDDLAAVQRRREGPTRWTQALQIFIQKHVISRVLHSPRRTSGLPLPLRLVRRFPILRRVPARVIGLGLRPEHIEPVRRRSI